MLFSLLVYNGAEYKAMVDLRYEVLRKPLGLIFSPEELAKEKDDLLLGVFDDERLVGCCILSPSGNALKLRQMAVDPYRQKAGIGKALLNFAETVAKEKKYPTIQLHARETAVSFYLKAGYTVSGNTFIEVGIPHYRMEKTVQK